VFGVIVWFVLFSAIGLGGAGGALLYRLGHCLRIHLANQEGAPVTDLSGSESGQPDDSHGSFGKFAQQAIYFLEGLPVPLTDKTFAIVGNFEGTIHCWRTQASSWFENDTGILLSSGAGEISVCLGMLIPQDGELME